MNKNKIIKRFEMLLIILTFSGNFGIVIYDGINDSHQASNNSQKVLFQTRHYYNLDARLRNLGYALLIVSLTEAGQLILENKK